LGEKLNKGSRDTISPNKPTLPREKSIQGSMDPLESYKIDLTMFMVLYDSHNLGRSRGNVPINEESLNMSDPMLLARVVEFLTKGID